jgi:hypothetical protein
MIFDGSDVGVTGNVDAFYFESDGSILLSLSSDATLPDAGAVTDADILRFTPTQLGDTTAGSFALLLDGSDVGLDMSNEDIDVIGRTADGKLFVSTTSDPLIPGVSGKRSDLFVFTPTSLGDTTSGSWSLLFDGSDVGLGDRLDVVLNENVDAAWLDVATGNLAATF